MKISRRLNFRLEDNLGLLLILLSSMLLGIWAVKGTIALRNGILGLETLLSGFYCYLSLKANPKVSLKKWTPLILLGLLFFWVIFHYLFFSRFHEQQLHELKSTWFRSALAAIVGLSTGLAIAKRPNAIFLLWMGILASFGYLLYQYIPKAIALSTLFVHDYPSYIFYGKISGVLAGTILVIGLLGSLLDTIKSLTVAQSMIAGMIWLLGTTTVLYAYVFIFDTRNGVGLIVIIFFIAILIFARRFYRLLFSRAANNAIAPLLPILIFVLALGWFGAEHLKHNPGWSTMWDDFKTSLQVNRYSNWQNPLLMGYPQNATGQVVKENTYERVSWATAGLTIFLPQNPLGVGILKRPFSVLLKEKYPEAGDYISSTHSAWVEIALAFGYPALFLWIGILMSICMLGIRSGGNFQALSTLFSIGLVLLYAVGEISSQHSIEILCFLVGLLTSLSTSFEARRRFLKNF